MISCKGGREFMTIKRDTPLEVEVEAAALAGQDLLQPFVMVVGAKAEMYLSANAQAFRKQQCKQRQKKADKCMTQVAYVPALRRKLQCKHRQRLKG
eukprot:1161355-Pelagomonas_calceolata.AAC.3